MTIGNEETLKKLIERCEEEIKDMDSRDMRLSLYIDRLAMYKDMYEKEIRKQESEV